MEVSRVDGPDALRARLSESFRELDDMVRFEDPLDAALQQARYDVYEALQDESGEDARVGVYETTVGAMGTSPAKRKRGDVGGSGGMADDWPSRVNVMNPKNLYSRREYSPDFAKLAARYPVLRQHIVEGGCVEMTGTAETVEAVETARAGGNRAPRVSYNFKSWRACRDLVAVQFEHDFGVRSWTVPEPHLVPPLANRLNYLCYLHDLFEVDGVVDRVRCRRTPAGHRVRILDVGCGANMVYPLLGAAYFGWGCIGCDVNEAALRHAAGIRDANPEIAPLIILRHARGLDALKDAGFVEATVCNPPFFDSETGEAGGQNPRTNYGGTQLEMWCAGGEEAFVVGLIRESRMYRDRCGWFSSMVGKKRTLKGAKAELARWNTREAEDAKEAEELETRGNSERENHAKATKRSEAGKREIAGGVTYRVCRLEQGATSRWVVAWRW